MADLAGLIYGTGQKVAEQTGDGAQAGIQQGAQLAQMKQNIDQQAQAMDVQKQQIQTAKVEKLYEYVGQAKNYQNAADRKNYLKSAIGLRNAMGLDASAIPDEMITGLGSDENAGRMYTLGLQVQSGALSPTDAMRLATDPQMQDKFAQVPVTPAELRSKPADLSTNLEEYLKRQAEMQKAKMEVNAQTARQNTQLSHMEFMQGAQELGKFGDAVANPSNRKNLGQQKATIDRVDSLNQIIDPSILPPKASKEQRIKAYDSLDSRQGAEVFKVLDSVLSRGNPTVSGNEHLTPPQTIEKIAARWKERLGNIPVGAGQGAFIERAMEVLQRERNIAQQKFNAQASSLKEGYPFASKAYGDKMDGMINAALAEPTPGEPAGGGGGGLQFDGRTWSREKLQGIVDKNINNPDPTVQAKVKAAQAVLGQGG